jgi:hypothetical protein
MGKVYVLRKDASASAGAAPAITNQGVGIVMNTSPEKVNYAKYGAGVDDKGKPYGGSAGQEKWARRIGNMGGKARVGFGALSGLNSLYNATSSGQPGALSALGQGAMSGYYGSQGLEGWAADKGAQFGAWRDQRNAPPKPDMNAAPGGTVAGVTPQARRDAMSMMPSGPMNPTMPPTSSYQLPVAGVGGVTPQTQSQAMNMLPSGAMNPTMPPAAGFKPGYGTPESTSHGESFSQAAPDPKKVGVTTSPTEITNYPSGEHPLVRERDKENESKDASSSSTTAGY